MREERGSGERKYYLSNLPAEATLKQLAATIKARWICEQAHQQMKEELGLDHFEGRSWTGLHRHALMTMMAYAFLQSDAWQRRGGKKESPARRPSPRCRRSGRPSWITSVGRRRDDARTVTPISTCHPETDAKVVLAFGPITVARTNLLQLMQKFKFAKNNVWVYQIKDGSGAVVLIYILIIMLCLVLGIVFAFYVSVIGFVLTALFFVIVTGLVLPGEHGSMLF